MTQWPETFERQPSPYSYERTSEDCIRSTNGLSDLPSIRPNPDNPAEENPAIFRCRQAYTAALVEAIDLDKSRQAREADIGRAYRDALPPLVGRENIADFVACVAHGMLLEVISGPDASRLLYAAQVATALCPPAPKAKAKRND